MYLESEIFNKTDCIYRHNANNFTTHKINVLRICLCFIFYVFNKLIYLTVLSRPTLYVYIILARNGKLPYDGVLTSKHVAASYIYSYVII